MLASLVFAPALFSGSLLAHLVWPDRRPSAILLKLFLGAGLGLGLRSLLYFLFLLAFPGTRAFIFLELAVLASLVALAWRQERISGSLWRPQFSIQGLTTQQRVLWMFAALIVIAGLLTTTSYLLRRRQGDWDAWMMYNRAARFLYFDQTHWHESFSPRMDPIFHADYPLLLASNISAGWDAIGRDSSAIPMLQSALFSVACVGVLAGSLTLVKSVGQAALGVIILWGVPVLVNEGARQMADVPMAFYILATGVLLYLFVLEQRGGLLFLAGLTAGLASWTKNEGAVLVLGGALAAAIIASRLNVIRRAWLFAAGLAIPVAVTAYFRIVLAPSGDILSGASGGVLAKLADAPRHLLILHHMWRELIGFGAWGLPGLGIGIIPILLLFLILFRPRIPSQPKPAMFACLVIVAVQLMGYYGAYVVSPYDLTWHLAYSSTRIVLQVFPLLLFLTLCSMAAIEEVLAS